MANRSDNRGRGKPPHDRVTFLASRIEIDRMTGCWLWTGYIGGNGYGLFWGPMVAGKRKRLLVHREVYRLTKGEIPEGLELDHLCRVRHCCRPSHLEPVDTWTNQIRGEGFSGRNYHKTHCPQGHEYTDENTLIERNPNGRPMRRCRICRRAQYRAWQEKNREKVRAYYRDWYAKNKAKRDAPPAA